MMMMMMMMRMMIRMMRRCRIGTRGNSKYHYYGIRVNASSVLNHMDLSSQPPRPPVAKKRVHKSGDTPQDQSIQVNVFSEKIKIS